MISCKYEIGPQARIHENTITNLRLNVLRCSPSRSFPILVYFKETQTPEENWNVGPGEQANSLEAIANGAGKTTISYRLPL
jgi:hypothetical protein